MVSTNALDNDEYVATLLAKDARESSIKYSAMGMSAFLPKRPTSAAPKPNKRFLGNLLRETDSHNAALKKKEELEARMRARGEIPAPSKSGRDQVNPTIEGSRKRRRVDEPRARSRSRDREQRSKRSRAYSEDRSESEDTRRRRRKHRRSDHSDDDRHYRSHRSPGKEKRSRHGRRERSRDRSPEASDSSRGGRLRRKEHRSHRRRSRSRRRSMSSHDSDQIEKDSHARNGRKSDYRRRPRSKSPPLSRSRSPTRRPKPEGPECKSTGTTSKRNGHRPRSPSASDSDPLESLVGPLPPPPPNLSVNDPPPLISRGRGAYKPSSSAMDKHFASNYDPSLDMHPEPEDEKEQEDWDMALEALRDREIWKRKGAERLRAAGFGDDEIKKWEDSGREKGVEDVKWATRGEAREWDRGKVVEAEGDKKGEVSLQAAWKKDGGFLRGFKNALG